VQQAVDRLPVFTAGVRLHRIGEGAAGFQEQSGALVGGACLDLTKFFDQHLLEVRA